MDEEYASSEDGEAEEKQEKAISSDLIRGHINTIILRSLYDGDKYGYEIISEIEGKSHGQYSLKQPTLYSALKRLEKDGYITSYWGGSVGGGRRKYFSLTDEGKAISEQNQSEWEYSRTIIDSLISDRDFDFANPAPASVNMRVLKDTTSRVPGREGDDEADFETAYGEEERARLEEDFAKRTAELEEEKAALEAEKARFEEEMRTREETFRAEQEAQNEQMKSEREAHESAIAEREQLVEEEYRKYEEVRAAQIEEVEAAKAAREQEALEKQRAIAEERERYDFLLAEKERRLAEEQEKHRAELEELEKRVREEEEARFRQREQEIIHQNYINLVNAPPAEPREQTEYNYYNAPAAEEPAPAQTTYSEEDNYQAVVRRLYENASGSAPAAASRPAEEPRARSLDGIDFRDVEALAEQDGIRITTAGGKAPKTDADSESIVHKGKALFMSALVVFFFCIALGGVALGVRSSIDLPLFIPCFIWAAGVCLLLVTGLAYANHYGERSLRRRRPILINTAVIYALLVIFTLIVALAVNGNFSSITYLATFIIFPIVFFFSVVIFGVVYYLQVRPTETK